VRIQCGLGFAKLFYGERIRKTSATNFLKFGKDFGFRPRAGGVWGGIRAGFFLGRAMEKNTLKCYNSLV